MRRSAERVEPGNEVVGNGADGDAARRARLRTVLIISRYFPPLFDIGGKRAYRFALHLPEHGWRPIVLAGPIAPGYPVDPTPLDLPATTHVVRDYTPRWWREQRLGFADGTQAEPIADQDFRGLRWWLAAQRRLPLKREVLLAPRTALLVRRLMRTTPIDLVFATAPPWAALVHGLCASGVAAVPLCLDLRDPWSLGFLNPLSAHWIRWVERHAEAGLFRRADRVIFTCEDAARAYRALYPALPAGRFAVIHNSFEPAQRPPPQPPAPRATLVHFGNCYGPRSLEPVLRALAELRRRGVVSMPRLLNLGRVLGSDLRLAERLGVRDAFDHQTMLPYAEGLRALAGADLQILLACGGGAPYIPAKFFDYLLSGRPVLCIAPAGEVTRLVEEMGVGRSALPSDVAAIADIIADAARCRGGTDARPNPSAIERFAAPNTARRLARLFDEILAERGRGPGAGA